MLPRPQHAKTQEFSAVPQDADSQDPFDWFLLRDLSVAAERTGRVLSASYGKAANLNIAEGRVLLVLAAFPSVSSGEVTSRTTMDKARVSRALSKLMLMGLIHRKAHADDRRQAVLRLTAKGQRVAAAVEGAARASQSDILATLSGAERAALRQSLRKIRACADIYLDKDPDLPSDQDEAD